MWEEQSENFILLDNRQSFPLGTFAFIKVNKLQYILFQYSEYCKMNKITIILYCSLSIEMRHLIAVASWNWPMVRCIFYVLQPIWRSYYWVSHLFVKCLICKYLKSRGNLFVCRLNSGPVQDFSVDVGNRTSIRMSYPESCPKVWEDMDSDLKYVAVIYKSVDFHWLRAMITKTSVVSACLFISLLMSRLIQYVWKSSFNITFQSLWDWLFFWQNVPVSVPIKASQFRLLNPEIIKETAMDLLHFPKAREQLWGWDQVSYF